MGGFNLGKLSQCLPGTAQAGRMWSWSVLGSGCPQVHPQDSSQGKSLHWCNTKCPLLLAAGVGGKQRWEQFIFFYPLLLIINESIYINCDPDCF